jgi:hypothetical protein
LNVELQKKAALNANGVCIEKPCGGGFNIDVADVEINISKTHVENVEIKHPEGDFQCFVGTKLIGCNNTLPGIVNGAFLRVTGVDLSDKSPPLITLLDEDSGEHIHNVTPAQVARHCKLRHALTLTSCQGRSLVGTIAIHDSNKRHFTSTHLYVGLSRAVNGKNIWIA